VLLLVRTHTSTKTQNLQFDALLVGEGVGADSLDRRLDYTCSLRTFMQGLAKGSIPTNPNILVGCAINK